MCEGGAFGWMWFGGLLWFVLIGGGIALIVWSVARGARGGDQPRRSEDDRALALLRERFARGEIGEDEYRERRVILDRDA